ncbi:choice-of-anchor D domain-containing protein [Conexibacter stalactiti]|uniref:Choice-of-anchor D domain-containing protein n=1 Tax=Conexibacter stalactiti TaxID=1940611 RepID=A0ABU4HY01_9ACTN|nr:choice-of-anchor D domain-containing protein [Conexibacter stalactiti]MDW5598151.1 choice-of-anchor D domain-containing protein [Conexibacter stalactiti]MEC5038793.1 choice-of-anchor D domain-containing protein [Conexibacter stalactiti]
MTQRTLRRALRAAAVCAVLPALAPAAASASTYTVDDDKAQCPSASFTSIQAAVDQAAPWDTVIVCDGLYEEQSTPASGVGSPSQTGSLNGLTITKPLTIKGTGAAKVTIMPSQSVPGRTLAGTAPYLRDGGGNVVTVSRQSRDATDMNTMFVDISGVTIRSGDVYAEAGVAFFNASGAIRNSIVGPLVRAVDGAELAARPHGWGVVATNHQQGAEAGPRREISVESSLVTGYQSGGVLFDVARGADGAPETLQRSGIVSYGYVRNSAIRGSGASTLIPQTGVEYHSGARGEVIESTITDHLYTLDLRRSVGLLLTDAETGVDPANPAQRAFRLERSVFTGNGYGMFNADAANATVRRGAPALARPAVSGTTESYFGCSGGPVIGGPSTLDRTGVPTCQGISGNDADARPSIDMTFARGTLPRLPAAPGVTADAAPTASLSEPVAGKLVVGEAFVPTVSANDDFGVRSVSVTLDGNLLGTRGTAPYEFGGGWTPDYDEIGQTHTLTTTVVDSAGQTTVTSEVATVVAPAGYQPITLAPSPLDAGAVVLGQSATKAVTITNSGGNPLTLTAVDVTGAGFARAGGCVSGTLAPGASCTVGVRFAPTAAGAASGALTVAYSAIGGSSPATVALSGSGVATTPPPGRRPPGRSVASIAATFARTTKVSRNGLLTLVTLRNSGTAAGTVSVTGTLRVGGARFAVGATRRVSAGQRVTLSVRLSRSARLALRRRGGTLTLRVVGAGSRAITRRIAVKRG